MFTVILFFCYLLNFTTKNRIYSSVVSYLLFYVYIYTFKNPSVIFYFNYCDNVNGFSLKSFNFFLLKYELYFPFSMPYNNMNPI